MDQAATVSLDRTRALVRDVVLSLDDPHDGDIEQVAGDVVRLELDAAREHGVFAPHAPLDCGGLGFGMVERGPVFEAAGVYLFGPLALNITAPNVGNIHLPDNVATAGQRKQFLRPLARGQVRWAFAMTEPAPGAGDERLDSKRNGLHTAGAACTTWF